MKSVDDVTDRDIILAFPVTERDINWAGSEPIPRIEDFDLLALCPDEYLQHIYALVAALRGVRLTLSVAVAKLAEADKALKLARHRAESHVGRNQENERPERS